MTNEGKTLTVIITGPNKSKVGETITFQAKVIGGTEPIKYKWSPGMWDNNKLVFIPSKPERYVIQVEIEDSASPPMVGRDMLLLDVED